MLELHEHEGIPLLLQKLEGPRSFHQLALDFVRMPAILFGRWKRGYVKILLRNQFCKAVEKYLVEFQKWVLPSRFDQWFYDITMSLG